MQAYHVDDLGECQAEGDVERVGSIQRRPDPTVVNPHQISD